MSHFWTKNDAKTQDSVIRGISDVWSDSTSFKFFLTQSLAETSPQQQQFTLKWRSETKSMCTICTDDQQESTSERNTVTVKATQPDKMKTLSLSCVWTLLWALSSVFGWSQKSNTPVLKNFTGDFRGRVQWKADADEVEEGWGSILSQWRQNWAMWKALL